MIREDKVCELLLRLRCNMLAPAMHLCSHTFYSHPENKEIADEYGIMITTSHCEPLLFNNLSSYEWRGDRDGEWDYGTNRQTIYDKLDSRVKEASGYENIYTMGLHGLHDEGIRGNYKMEDRASNYTPVDSTFMTYGDIVPVKSTPFDFTAPRAIRDSIALDNEQIRNANGYDHNFVLDHNNTDLAATLYDPRSGIFMEVFTDEPGIQVYTGNFLDGTVTGKNGIAYPQRAAICLETQHYPDSPNKLQWPSVRLNPGEKYKSSCKYRFSIQ